MSDPFVAEIRIFPFNFAPRGWAFCNGQLLPISQNTALFSLLGTFYGGDGKSTFALPDLQGRVPMHQGQGPGLSQRFLGEAGGAETVTLLESEIPFHNHVVSVSTARSTAATPTGNFLSRPYAAGSLFATTVPNTTLAVESVSVSGGSQPHNNVQPSLVLNFCIALQGIFPPRG